MANRAFTGAYSALIRGDVDWLNDTIAAILIRGAEYAFSASDSALQDIPSSARASTVVLSGCDESNGYMTASNPTWPLVAAGSDVTAVLIFQDTGDEATSRLLFWLDDVVGLPRPTGGTNITLAWPSTGVARLRDGIAAAEAPEPEARIQSAIYTEDATDIEAPSWASRVLIEAIGGGGGGGSGYRRDGNVQVCRGGGGGDAGHVAAVLLSVSTLGFPLSVAIGAGGAGGAAVTVSTSGGTSGADGTAGGDTVVYDSTASSICTAHGGAGGIGGWAAGTPSPSAGGYGLAGAWPGTSVGASGIGPATIGPGSGGAAGGIGASDAGEDGGAGGAGMANAPAAGGTAGDASGTRDGQDGTSVASGIWGGGGGGGGGASVYGNSSAAAGKGGDGGEPGGGGGGGGPSENGGAPPTSTSYSGAGGDGAKGRVRITWIGAQLS